MKNVNSASQTSAVREVKDDDKQEKLLYGRMIKKFCLVSLIGGKTVLL